MNVYGIELLQKVHHKKDIFRPISLLEFTENILDTEPHFQNSGMTMEGIISPPPNDQ